MFGVRGRSYEVRDKVMRASSQGRVEINATRAYGVMVLGLVPTGLTYDPQPGCKLPFNMKARLVLFLSAGTTVTLVSTDITASHALFLGARALNILIITF